MAQKRDPQQVALLDILAKQLQLEGNTVCADCDQKTPKWSSTNLGVYMCMNCSGCHRHIGTNFSKVKSTNMDHWTKEQVDFMVSIGNARANLFWEAKLPSNFVRPTETIPRQNFIMDKYVRRRYIDETKPVPPCYASLFPGKQIGTMASLGPAPGIAKDFITNPGLSTSPIPSSPSSFSSPLIITPNPNPTTNPNQPRFINFNAPVVPPQPPPQPQPQPPPQPQYQPPPPVIEMNADLPNLISFDVKPPVFDLQAEIMGLLDGPSASPYQQTSPYGKPSPYQQVSPYPQTSPYTQASPYQQTPPYQQPQYGNVVPGGYPPNARSPQSDEPSLLQFGTQSSLTSRESNAILSLFDGPQYPQNYQQNPQYQVHQQQHQYQGQHPYGAMPTPYQQNQYQMQSTHVGANRNPW